MACSIPYLQKAQISETERTRLEEIHTSIFEQARDSKFFRRIDNRFQVIKNLYPKATEFVGKVNSQFGKPITSIKSIGNGNSILSVNVLPLSNEQQSDLFFNLSSPQVNFSLKSVQILQSPKADEIFRKGDKNNWSLDKILQELQVPKEQQELIKSFNTRNREEILTSLLANYSYTIEINTAKTKEALTIKEQEAGVRFFEQNGQYFYEDMFTSSPIKVTKDKYDRWIRESIRPENEIPTQYYSNLTVLGGTNYTENEIATPAIIPSIKGHAQFATDNGIGWFRSDDKHPFTGFLEDLIASGTIKKVPCG